MDKKNNDRSLIALIVFLETALLIVDIQFPLGVGLGILYIIPSYISFYLSKISYVYLIALMTFVFCILGAVISPPVEGDLLRASMNRILSFSAVVVLTILGANQKKIKDSILNFNQELAKQSWIKNGQVNLQEVIKGEKTLAEISKIALYELASYIAASVGVLYLVDENNKLTMFAGYSYPDNLKFEFDFNEGLVGRVAVEKKIIRLNDNVIERISLKSSFGEMEPKEIIAIPLLYNLTTVGVLEFAFPNKIDAKTLELLESIKDSLGISMNSAVARDKVNKLLEETQRQAEELSAQQKELEATNEELSSQQRELEASNEELEEQRSSLEEQKQRLENTNKALVLARRDIEQKAQDLEISGKYKSEFLANMSHELRTPLNSILILSKLIFEDKENRLTDDQKENAKIIYDSGNDLLNLINDILDLSKVEAGKLEINMEEIPVDNLANGLERAFRTQIENKGLKYEVELDPEAAKVICSDRLRLEQIIKNFLSNAIKFTEKGGIKVTLKKADNNSIAISVQDSGIGIPDDKKQLIFEAFQQIDGSITRRFGGSGLGLSISRSLAEKLGGSIKVESKLGQGSLFTLILPANFEITKEPIKPQINLDQSFNISTNLNPSFNMEHYAAIIPDDRNSIGTDDKVILIFEPERVLADVVANHCHQLGYKCIISTSGESGMEDALRFNPNSIIVDVELPDQNGLIILDRLKNNPQTRHIPIYVMSTEPRRSESLKLGAVGMLDKNKDLANIPAIIKKLERIYQQKNKKVLLIEDNKIEQDSIKKLITDRSVEVESAETGAHANELLKASDYDCIILDLKLQDMTGFQFLEMLKNNAPSTLAPIIVYTGKDLSSEEQRMLEEVSSSIVIKGAKSPERLLNEVTLFLHKIESEMPEDKQKILKYARHREQVYEGKKVLIVDDDIRNVYSLKQILQDRNMELFMASTGQEALERLTEHPEIDIILMDIMMPVMNGYEAMEEIRKTKDRKDLPILALTAKAMPGDRDKCLSSGANDYLPKPIDPERLLSLLRVWLSR